MSGQRETGDKAEQIAASYLKGKGYEILERNWYYGHMELDIIAKEKNQLVIVEVKSRTGLSYEHPSEAITKIKIRRIIEAADAYILDNDIEMETRFDIITVIFYKENYELEHYEDAFYPTL